MGENEPGRRRNLRYQADGLPEHLRMSRRARASEIDAPALHGPVIESPLQCLDVTLYATAEGTRGSQEQDVLANAKGWIASAKSANYPHCRLLFAPEYATIIYICDLP